MSRPDPLGARLVRLGPARSAALITGASVLGSVALCVLVWVVTGEIHDRRWDMWVLPVLVPLLVAPTVTVGLVRTLARVQALQEELAREVAERRAAERELDVLAHTDPLTGLLNRRGLAREAGRLAAVAAARDEVLAVIALDLDGLKALNDDEGHAAGDRAITDAARALVAAAGPGAAVARVGGDEFIVLVPGGVQPVVVGARLAHAARADGLALTYGAATLAQGEPLEDALADADGALVDAKRARAERAG